MTVENTDCESVDQRIDSDQKATDRECTRRRLL